MSSSTKTYHFMSIRSCRVPLIIGTNFHLSSFQLGFSVLPDMLTNVSGGPASSDGSKEAFPPCCKRGYNSKSALFACCTSETHYVGYCMLDTQGTTGRAIRSARSSSRRGFHAVQVSGRSENCVEDRQRHIRHPLLYIGQACSPLIDPQSTLFQTTYLEQIEG